MNHGDVASLGASEELVAAFDSMGTVVFADPELVAFFGHSPEEVGHLNIDALLAGPHLSWLAHVVGRMFADGSLPSPQVYRARGPSGAKRPFVVSLARMDRPDGSVFVAATLRPIAS